MLWHCFLMIIKAIKTKKQYSDNSNDNYNCAMLQYDKQFLFDYYLIVMTII